jgi:ABC-type Fe3+/spermidine/putrescine transport system ATPase subunit
MNFLPGLLEGGRLVVARQTVPFASAAMQGVVDVAIRPESVLLAGMAGDSEAIALNGEVRKVTFLGREAHYTLKTEAGEIVAQVADPERDFIEMEGRPVEVRLPLDKIVLFGPNGDVVTGQA